MNLNLVTHKRRDSVVTDLLLRKPKGDTGCKPVYEEASYYCYDAHKDKSRVECNHPGWGYSDEAIWDLGFRTDHDISRYIFERFYKSDDIPNVNYLSSGRRAGVTRKTNRISSRISQALRRVVNSGEIPGTYCVRIGWQTQLYFYGESSAEIQALSETMLRALYPDDDFSVTFVDRSVPGDMLDLNVSSIQKIEENAQKHRKQAEKNLESAKLAESQVEFVKTLITQNLEVAMRAS